MKKLELSLVLLFAFAANLICAQSMIEGYVYESGNRGYLNLVKISVFSSAQTKALTHTFSNKDGFFQIPLDEGTYTLKAEKDNFITNESKVKVEGQKVFSKIEMEREPGYMFEATLAPVRSSSKVVVDAIRGARIEVFNQTKDQQELELRDHPDPEFKFPLKQGNHYTLMIRKEGYLTKRIEAYVNVEGCILCLDGVGDVRPGVTDNLTAGHELGVLLTNIELEPVKVGSKFVVENIYYDFDRSYIRSDAAEGLDNLATVLRDNPKLIVELGSHTDSRGKDEYNMKLSEARAKSAVNYLIQHGVYADRISAKGYGESQLVNDCFNGKECTEDEHQENRRTEIKVTGISAFDELAQKTLAQIIREEKFLESAFSGEEIVMQEGEEMPKDLQEYLDQKSQAEAEDQEEVEGQRSLFEPLPEKFSGYTLLLTNNTASLQQLRSIVNLPETVYEYETGENKYYIMGEYRKIKKARRVLKPIGERWPQAEIVFFRNGKMIR